MKIDIVTGFLGAGKTTFISSYGKYLNEKNERVIIIENEFGLAGVDGSLLRNQEMQVVEIAGGCVCCTQKNNLILCLVEAYENGYERVIIEPSGIYNLDTFFDLLEAKELKDKCELNGIITIVKPDFMKYSEGDYKNIFMSQFMSTGAIVFSNTQSYTTEQIDKSLLELSDFAKKNNSNFSISDVEVYTQPWDDLTEEDFKALSVAGRSYCEHNMIFENHAGFVDNMFFQTKFKTVDDIKEMVDFILNLEGSEILRVKGYSMAMDDDAQVYEVNCTHNCTTIKKSKSRHAILNVIGLNLDRDTIENKAKELSAI